MALRTSPALCTLLFASTQLTACAISESTDPAGGEGFEYEPGLFMTNTPLGDSKADLPNQQFRARPLDTSGYRKIADLFVAAGIDVKLTGAPAAYDWPLSESHAVLSRQGTPIRLSYDVYEHTGLDIIRNSEDESPVMRAPTSGTALVSDWYGEQSYWRGDYSTVVSIWDPVTHHILQLMHVKADPSFPRGTFFEVERGQVIGELAHIHIEGGKHTHVNVIDAERFELVDPVTVMPSYPDTVRPKIGELYLLDATTARHDRLQTGPLDIVVTATDRDDASPRNLEIHSISFTARDQNDVVLARLPRCRLSDAYKQLVDDWTSSSSTIRLIDFGNATGQFHGFWPSSDLGNPDRLFRYAVTNLRVDASGTCSVVAQDRDGQVEISDATTELKVTVVAWDARGNRTQRTTTLTRAGSTPDPEPEP
jgi:hypothetical protein